MVFGQTQLSPAIHTQLLCFYFCFIVILYIFYNSEDRHFSFILCFVYNAIKLCLCYRKIILTQLDTERESLCFENLFSAFELRIRRQRASNNSMFFFGSPRGCTETLLSWVPLQLTLTILFPTPDVQVGSDRQPEDKPKRH